MQERPRLKIPWYPGEKAVEIAAFLGLAFLVWTTVSAWADIPGKVPTHFGFSGKPDAWGTKQSLLLLPCVGFLLYLLTTLMEYIPHRYNYPVAITAENAEKQYRLGRSLLIWVKVFLTATFAYLQWIMIEVAEGRATGIPGLYLPVLLGGILIVTLWHVAAMRKAR